MRARALWYLLLLPPFVGLLWTPFYASANPKLLGFPFFYWYQFVWVIVAAVLTGIVYLATRSDGQDVGDSDRGEQS
jgi:hypothetical protein